MSAVDLSLSFPSRGVIRLQSRSLFGDPENPTCRRFLRRVFQAAEITGVTIRGGRTPHAELRFPAGTDRPDRVVERIAALLRQGTDGPGPSPHCAISSARDSKGVVRFFRHGTVVTGWEIRRDEPGRLRMKNRVLHRRSALCRAIERELRGVLGIESYRTSSLTGTVQVDYDPSQLDPRDLIEILDAALAGAEPPPQLDKQDLHLPLCTASMPIAAAAQFAVPALLPAAAALLACTSIPTLREAYRTLTRERRLGADALDSAVVIGCLGTMSIFPGAVLCWGLGLGRVLVRRTRDNSRKMLLDAFGKQPRRARLLRDGAELPVPIDRLRKGDLVVVDAGEVIPVDGRVVAGLAMIDPQALTGGSAAAEKGAGDRVLASTLMIGGRVYVSVEAAGGETAAARIGRALDEAAGHELSSQQRGERLAERLAIPTLALGAVGMAAMGPVGGLAVVNRDFGSGIRMAAPVAMLGALALCAHRGILVKDARALDRMNEVDTVVIDLSATPAGERPEVPDVVRNLRHRGIRAIAIIAGDPDATTGDLAGSPGMDGHLAQIPPADKGDYIASLQAGGRKVCFVGDGISDPIAMNRADVSISMRGASSIDVDAAQVVFLEPGLSRLCELRDIARDLDRNVKRSWSMILAPNVACIAGVFTMGLGIMASVVINNLAALAALGNGVLPLRKVAQLEAERRHRHQITRIVAAGRALPAGSDPPSPSGPVSGEAELASPRAATYDRNDWDLVRDASPVGGPGDPSFTNL